MTRQVYTPHQVESATKILNAIASVPSDKQEAFIRYIEAMSIGAEIACKSKTQRSA